MDKVIRKTRKFRTAIVSILTFATLIITCWQFYKSSPDYNLSGNWNLNFTVQSSSYKPYIGECHTQRVSFCQNNCEIKGEGEKWKYNGKLLPFDKHRKVEYYGVINGSEFKATYKLFGKLRESSGNICLKVSSDGKHLEGIFNGTAGDSKGTVTGERID